MASVALKEVLSRLPNLSQKELGEVRKRLEFFIQYDAAATKTVSNDWLLRGILHELKRGGFLPNSTQPPLSLVKKIAPNYQQHSAMVKETLLKAIAFSPNPPQLIILGRLAAQALIEDLDGGPAPVCLQVVLQNAHRIPGAVDRCYPGYLACRLLGALIR